MLACQPARAFALNRKLTWIGSSEDIQNKWENFTFLTNFITECPMFTFKGISFKGFLRNRSPIAIIHFILSECIYNDDAIIKQTVINLANSTSLSCDCKGTEMESQTQQAQFLISSCTWIPRIVLHMHQLSDEDHSSHRNQCLSV